MTDGPTDRQTDRPTDGPTDTVAYRSRVRDKKENCSIQRRKKDYNKAKEFEKGVKTGMNCTIGN